ncbi:MAG: GDP-mannose 4,6-dehydratase [Kiritimatiellae bacterium]|nr:GDP-mannose 4,6-dehydratase [Kiritimatiellia bacterium]
MKVLITGSNGFVARYLVHEYQSAGVHVVGIDMNPFPAYSMTQYYSCDLVDSAAIRAILAAERPDVIIHLAAVSSVGRSWQIPVEAFLNNTNIFLNLVEAIRVLNLHPRILSIGSSEEYGNLSVSDMPLRETHQLNPCSPYAVARVAQEQLSRVYVSGYGLDIVMTRSFNQIGPGQRPDFFVPSMVEQIRMGLERGGGIELVTGDLSIVRDFLDVRDAVSAYRILVDRGATGEVYNVCSGVGHSLHDVVNMLASLLGVEVSINVDRTRFRPADNHVIIGDNTKMRLLGWSPKHDFTDTLRELLDLR